MTIPSGATGSITLSVSTGTTGTAMLDTPEGWRLLPLTCGLLLFAMDAAAAQESSADVFATCVVCC